MAIGPDRLVELTKSLVAGIEQKREDSRARMEASRRKQEPVSEITVDEGPAGGLEGMGQVASNLRGQRPESPEKAAEKLEYIRGKGWVRRQ